MPKTNKKNHPYPPLPSAEGARGMGKTNHPYPPLPSAEGAGGWGQHKILTSLPRVIASGAVRHIRAAIHKPVRSTLLLLAALLTAALLTATLLPSSPKRYAVFAGYNPNGTIAPYVLTYLKALNDITDGVVYIADSELNPEEEKKLAGLTIYTQHHRHNEYDWGSYKQGYNWLKRNGYLKNADELIFANDSTYAPIGGSFKPMFEAMDKKKELDFWGDSQNKAFQPHLQSYFMVFRRPVFTAPEFRAFLNNVRHLEHSTEYIILYETALTPYLANLGYKWDSYIDYARFPLKPEIDTTDINGYPLTAIRDFNHLFLKRRTFTTNLLIVEPRDELLRYIAKHYPESYKDIARDIAPHFIPTDLSAQTSPFPNGKTHSLNLPFPNGKTHSLNLPFPGGKALSLNLPFPGGKALSLNLPFPNGKTHSLNLPFPGGRGKGDGDNISSSPTHKGTPIC